MAATDPTVHEINVFEFEAGVSRADQMAMINSLKAIKYRLRGIVLHQFYHGPSFRHWVEHIAWCGDAELHNVNATSAEAVAIMNTLAAKWSLIEYEPGGGQPQSFA